MRSSIERLADRLVGSLAPKTTAGACPCNDSYYGNCGANGCSSTKKMLFRTNCDCSKTTRVGCVSCG